jgi:tetratricopeptide (TPR) repeat protein
VDPTTLIYGALIAIGLLGADAVLESGTIAVEVTAPAKSDTYEFDLPAVESQFENVLGDITSTKSVVRPPEIVWSRNRSVGLAVAETLNFDKVAVALKSQLGFNPDRLRLAFFVDDGVLRALISGAPHRGSQEFGEVLTLDKGETLMNFVRRCALFGVSQIAPYGTAIHLMEEHAADKDFTDVLALADHAKAELPPTPTSADRALFNNLLGLIALFKNDPKGAETDFVTAMADDPTNPVGFLNAGFAELQLDEYPEAANRMEQLLRLAPPDNKELTATAYMTWAAAMIGLHQLDAADRLLASATEVAPDSATAFGLWAEERRLAGDQKTADELDRRALENTATFENYAEVAALYFHLAWADNRPVELNKFGNPGAVSFH